ncbi:universal stress protein [Natronomonas sp. F2-12]|jgi:nucleotide-binding universal stress UspA family protein|uniref:Universal stress protein n=1 Tax=Natronomonas aquatica TaxID=2841590 RepID=A0A9R1CRC3_9EURY|nr:universal stress protein [Natronomonas aquatica]MCQ4333758.1 universal stress protein [Natronomonas aquatica]
MTHIVLAVDTDEERARLSAEGVADLDWDTDTVTVSVLHVFVDNPEGASVNQIRAARRAKEALEDAGIETRLAERSGDPAAEVIDFVEDEGADAIALAGRNRTPAGKAMFGSVSQSVMLDSDVPVVFCPTTDD